MDVVKILRALFVFVLTTTVMPTSAASDPKNLPTRTTPIPTTTDSVPHVQLGIEPVPAISAALLAHVSGIPDIEIRDTVISLPGTKGFWLSENIILANPDVIVGGREFAHIHPDGSLHAPLPPELVVKAVAEGWAIPHPWAIKGKVGRAS